jgi:hypothetical protein
MKKEYITCNQHDELKFRNEDELIEHVEEVHYDDIDYYLDNYRDEAVDNVASDLKEIISVDADEVETDEEPAIDFDKMRREVTAGRQKTLIR